MSKEEGDRSPSPYTMNFVTNFINQMGVERRWVICGSMPRAALDKKYRLTRSDFLQVHRLLSLLRHETYGAVNNVVPESYCRKAGEAQREWNDKKVKSKSCIAWNTLVTRPYYSKDHRDSEKGRKELHRVLDEVMIMHSDGKY